MVGDGVNALLLKRLRLPRQPESTAATALADGAGKETAGSV